MDPRAQELLTRGDALAGNGRLAEAAEAYRQALKLDPSLERARFNLAQVLTPLGRASEALALTQALPASGPDRAAGEIARASALSALDRHEEALPLYRRGARRDPTSSIWTHNLAIALLQSQRHEEAEKAARNTIKLGSAEGWNLLGGALQGQGKLAEAEQAYRNHLAQSPLDVQSHRALSALVWQRTGSASAMNADLEEAIKRHADALDLQLERARNLADVGQAREAYEALGPLLARGAHPIIEVTAAVFALDFDSARALDHARTALNLAPDALDIAKIAVEALLANGEAQAANRLVGQWLARQNTDQYLWGLQAIAWRILGDERYRVLYDYDALVRPYELPAPKGWRNLSAYLDDLKGALRRLHRTNAAPLDQSLRKGSQTQRDLTRLDDPAIRAFFTVLRQPLDEYRAAVGQGPDPLRARNKGGEAKIAGSWSVRLQPGGFHISHVHVKGWLSSAFYVDLPSSVNSADHGGWIKFGEPGRPTQPRLEAEHFVQPLPGRLVLFPSYMWHATVPFSGDQTRLTLAFDVVPADENR